MGLSIGIDFDNTIVCYDEIFYLAALEKSLVPAECNRTKEAVRDYLRACNMEEAWTELQGYVYGSRMRDVAAFPGVVEFMREMVVTGTSVYIISHKTRHPYVGPAYDLHMAAQEWLEQKGFFEKGIIGLDRGNVFFEETNERKLMRISEMGCSHFIDDLPEFLLEEKFPKKTERLLFAPCREAISCSNSHTFKIFGEWSEIRNYFNGTAKGIDTCRKT